MGSGKSTVGKKLAHKIGYHFIDFDQLIEEHLDLSIETLFKTKGEAYFRNIETQLLNNLDVSDTVISLGGGTPCFNGNLSLINQKGISIYLKMSTKILIDRLIHSKTIRPLIENFKHNTDLLEEKINDLLIVREPFYSKADIIFKADTMTAKKYDDLLEEIENYFLSF